MQLAAMQILGYDLSGVLTPERIADAVRVLLTILIGVPLVFGFSRWIKRMISKHIGVQQAMLAGKGTSILGLAAILVMVLQILEFPLSTLLGAAGIFSLAIAFASQTSVSNIISGIFLATEKTFKPGDLLTVSGFTGEVISVDTLSVKLRTFDNRLVRIPNENMIKTEMQNFTAFPLRRIDLNVSVAYKEDLKRVRQILLDIATEHPLVLQEPKSLVILAGFGASSIDILFAIWGVKTDFLTIKNEVTETIKRRFDEEGIEIPFPHLSLYKGEASEPFTVRVIQDEPESATGV
ncbi:MAG TPA: mechanosensitive ion channel family protein [Acidobacteriota bacterium]|nr:mechanosensitive ion channel family protein [Acidobacteriota bacterium]